jgi:pilus assembly protein CpaC
MFSHNSGRRPALRRGAQSLIVSLMATAAISAWGQELTAPLQAPGSFQQPGPNQQPGPMQSPGAIQRPGNFQGPGLIQSPGGYQSLPTPPDAPEPGSLMQNTGMPAGPSLIHRIQAASERIEMTVNSSRVLTLDQPIPRAQVNNKEILELTPLSPNEIQVFAKKAGVTSINLWGPKDQVYTIDCVVYGDARELAELLKTEFPAANLRVKQTGSSVLLTGFVDRADQVSQIIQVAQEYYPKVIPNIRVGGVQQILLHCKVAEVSRTKARSLGFDFANINGSSFIASSISGLLAAGSVIGGPGAPAGAGDTVRFGVVNGNNAFFGFLEALRKEDILKILSDPTLVAVSGRPAFFNSGGEFPILVPQSLGTVSIEYKKFGTQIDFVPIVLGNGNIRLEVRPRISEIDPTRSITINGTTVPGLRVRETDTGVEMRAGQTLAIAGLVQTRLEAEKAEIPWLGEMPWVGAAFRRTTQTEEEIELLILVTPEVVAPLDCGEVPQCFPGMHSDVPNDCQLYWRGYSEVPSKGPCGCAAPGGPGMYGPQGATDGAMPGAYENVPPGTAVPTPAQSGSPAPAMPRLNGNASGSPPPNADTRYNPSTGKEPRTANRANGAPGSPGLIGPVGYDVLN